MSNRAIRSHVISFGAAIVAGVAVWFLAPAWLLGMARTVAGYDVAVLVLLVWYWAVVAQPDAEVARLRAAVEDPGRNLVVIVVLAAVGFGLAAAIDILGPGPHRNAPNHEAIAYTLGLSAVILGWLLIHTIFLFRYARLYYQDRDRDRVPDAGLIFPGTAAPSDWDFAYFSFVLGMTFQVSDVQITDPSIRRLALGHGMISFAYNTAILALGINVILNLLH